MNATGSMGEGFERRRFFAICSSFGLGSTLFPGVLWGLAHGSVPAAQNSAGPSAPAGQAAAPQKTAPLAPDRGTWPPAELPKITLDMIEQAAIIAAVPIPPEDRQMMLQTLNDQRKGYLDIYKLAIPNSVAPALVFDPVLPGTQLNRAKRPMRISAPAITATNGAPRNIEDICFYTARDLAELVRTRKVSSMALTEMYLERLHRYDPLLHFVITFTEDRARAKAKEADREIASGKYRGPLHGLPWGAKDLLAVAGYPTTWGAGGFETQQFDQDAVVVKRLDAAGAVLIAKLSLGQLAMDDAWFKARTRNPWNPAQGSSGSSAGSASAVAAGCVAFAIGSETLGSISAPSTRCGCTGLRPTFGLVPRTGAMALAWSMDKLGPICRQVEDCAIVLSAIYGPDGGDRAVRPAAFNWDANLDWRKLRVGYLQAEFERHAIPPPEAGTGTHSQLTPEEQKKLASRKDREQKARARAEYDRRFNDAALAKLRAMGVQLVSVDLPKMPYDSISTLLLAESAAAFDQLTRTGRDKLLTQQGPQDWPNTFRSARFIPAVEYIQENRARLLAMEAVAKAFAGLDVIVAPTSSVQLVVTNLTGHPALILPNGFRGPDAPPPTYNEKGEITEDYGGPGTPVSLTFIGQLYGEARLLAFARAYQQATDFHLKHPALRT